MWLYLETGSSKGGSGKMRSPGWGPDPTGLGSLQEEEVRTQTHTQRGPCEDTGRSRPSTRPGAGPQEDQRRPHPGLGFQPPGLETRSVCGVCYSSQS